MRHVVWFSCGAASAVAARLCMDAHPDTTTVVYCDTSASEHRDNMRFFADVERWVGAPIVKLRSEKYRDVDDVFEQTRYMAGLAGARCTVEMKKVPRFKFQKADDIHVFGMTADEVPRIERLENNNPELSLLWILRDMGITKRMCYDVLSKARIAIPLMYRFGYKHNNCIGCVKATSPKYWSAIKRDFPDVFERRVKQSRDIGCRLVRVDGQRVFLDEMPVGDYDLFDDEQLTCGPECAEGGWSWQVIAQ